MRSRTPSISSRRALAPNWQAFRFPCGDAAFEVDGVNAGVMESLGDALTGLFAVHAMDHGVTVFWQAGAPRRHCFRRYATVTIAVPNLTATSNDGPQTQNNRISPCLARTIFSELGYPM